MADSEKILDRIRKLLALSKSPNEAEAQAASAKASELLREYNLTEADIGDKPEPSKVKEQEHGAMRKVPDWRRRLGAMVAKSCSCGATVSVYDDSQAINFIGRSHNIAAAIALYDYLGQAIHRLSRQLKDRRLNREKYRIGVVLGLERRLQPEEQEQPTSSTALVVLQDEIDQHKAGMDLRPGKALNRVDFESASLQRGWDDSRKIGLDKQLDATTRRAIGGAR